MINLIKTEKCTIRGEVYKWVNLVDDVKHFGKCYVGNSTDAENRKRQFENYDRRYAGKTINKARRKFRSNFVYVLLEVWWGDDEDELRAYLDKIESAWIKKENSAGKGGYNYSIGGRGCKGKHHSKKHKERIGKANKGKVRTSAMRDNYSEAHKKRPVKIEIGDEVYLFKSISEASRELGKNPGYFHYRLEHGNLIYDEIKTFAA